MSQILTIERIEKIVGQKKVPDKWIDEFNRDAIKAYSSGDRFVFVYFGKPYDPKAEHLTQYMDTTLVRPMVNLLNKKGYSTSLDCGWTGRYIKVYLEDDKKNKQKEPEEAPAVDHEWACTKSKPWWHFW